jgi:hypothetical protein
MISLFKKKQTNKTYNPVVPSGLIAHTEKGYFYIKGNKRFKFVSDRAMNSWSLPIIVTIESKVVNFAMNGTLGFRDGTLVKDISDGKIYLISDNKRRHVVDPDVLEWINSDILEVGQKEILVHEEGENLNGS